MHRGGAGDQGFRGLDVRGLVGGRHADLQLRGNEPAAHVASESTRGGTGSPPRGVVLAESSWIKNETGRGRPSREKGRVALTRERVPGMLDICGVCV